MICLPSIQAGRYVFEMSWDASRRKSSDEMRTDVRSTICIICTFPPFRQLWNWTIISRVYLQVLYMRYSEGCLVD
uniref:Uncharacterized protein n=1 Tax=Oryza brachyantha TaxID=4533 RepID=J3LYK9_ORYBR